MSSTMPARPGRRHARPAGRRAGVLLECVVQDATQRALELPRHGMLVGDDPPDVGARHGLAQPLGQIAIGGGDRLAGLVGQALSSASRAAMSVQL